MDIPFSAIDISWLNKYEKWLRFKGNKETTMSLMFRTLRSAYNKAIKAKCARKSDYPFDEYKINKFDTKTQKRAIAKTEVLKFTKEVGNIGKRQYVQLSKDIFIFSYLCGGINFTDIANLTKANITNGRLHYVRQKTGKLIKLGISEEAMQIIKKYESESKGYLFPILNANIHKTPLQKQNRIHKMLGKVNKNLKLIAAQLNVDANMITYVVYRTSAHYSEVAVDFVPVDDSKVNIERADDYLPIRKAYFDLSIKEAETKKEQPDLREKLNTRYDAFVSKWGYFHNKDNKEFIMLDSLGTEVFTIEMQVDKNIFKSDIIREPVAFKKICTTIVHSPSEVLVCSLNLYAKINMNYIMQATGKDSKEIIKDLKGEIFYNPINGEWEHKGKFLAGNVIAKHKEITSYIPNLDDKKKEICGKFRTGFKRSLSRANTIRGT